MKAKDLFAAMFILLTGCATRNPLPTVAQVDLARYAGEWHEIARYPNWFQRGCAGGVTARYTPEAKGTIVVENSCRKADGTRETVRGTATPVAGSGNARLKVRFFGPFAGDYWIIGLDPQYRWALVGHPSRKYLWILARTPTLPDAEYDRIVALAVRRGYDATRIQRSAL
jgi:apolipoprotein D and lipocalin family protein